MSGLERSVALVTGASGFVGAHLTRLLAERGVRVHGTGSEPPRRNLPLEAWHEADLREPVRLNAVIEHVQPRYVFHLAGQSSAARSFEIPVETFRINALGTWHLLEAIRNHAPEARVLVVGTSEIYGPQPEGSRADERTPFRPLSPYALSKAAADAYAAQASSLHGMNVIRTRSFGHAGPGQEPPFAIPSWAQQIVAIECGAAEPVLKVGNLEVTRDLSDVRDVVEAYLVLVERGQPGAAYNVCRGIGAKLSDLVEMLVRRARVPIRIEHDPKLMRPADVPYLVGNPEAIERDTGWRAKLQLERTRDDGLLEWRTRKQEITP